MTAKMMKQRTAIVGGGAAGFFLAINLKEMCPQMEVTIMESAGRVLRKVELSGGGRCNLTNTFEHVADLQTVYPRGHRLMKSLLKHFGTVDTCQWFERHGVALTAQADGCVFPLSQDAHTISGLFMSEARRLGIAIKTGCRVTTLDELNHFDNICIAIGGQPRSENLRWLEHDVVEPVPSLFTLSVADQGLRTLMGTVIDHTMVMIPGTKMRAQGALLLTHWGLSGPAILRLSSYGARLLAEHHYQMPLMVNWAGVSEAEAANAVATMVSRNSRRQLMGMTPLELPQRLWAHLAVKALGQRAVQAPWGSVNAKEQRRLATVLTADECEVSGRAPHRDEFVTCGGVALSAVHQLTLESRTRPRLYFAGEVLDVDGITGGFNLQAAWTMAHTVARAIAAR